MVDFSLHCNYNKTETAYDTHEHIVHVFATIRLFEQLPSYRYHKQTRMSYFKSSSILLWVIYFLSHNFFFSVNGHHHDHDDHDHHQRTSLKATQIIIRLHY